ncbi:hypothetical protein GALL_153060 [mine drainage metagenome]|uniref:Uncharacterized protein n=1 Tax=mine drainage metagenome TaxID=410659 RepID=A0A1J5SEX3_9ZZZZ
MRALERLILRICIWNADKALIQMHEELKYHQERAEDARCTSDRLSMRRFRLATRLLSLNSQRSERCRAPDENLDYERDQLREESRRRAAEQSERLREFGGYR